MTSPIVPQDIRNYLSVTGTTGRYSDQSIGSNIRAAQSFLARATGRQFLPQIASTKVFTTEGRAFIQIPDLRTASTVSLQGAALSANASYWLVPDVANDGIYLGIQFRQFNRLDYKSNPEWFDRNLDSWLYLGRESNWGSLPNDLTITGDWGWDPYPDDYITSWTEEAAYRVKLADAVLARVSISPEGNVLDYSQHPRSVRDFIELYRLTEQAVMV
jgi:hypothetical protein